MKGAVVSGALSGIGPAAVSCGLTPMSCCRNCSARFVEVA
jgi:hypothetical protein